MSERDGDRDRDERSGRYVESLSEADILAVFKEREDPYEPLSAGEIGEVTGFDRRTVDTRLRQMAERNRVATKKLGARARAWWLSPATQFTAGTTANPDRDSTTDMDDTIAPSADAETAEEQLKRLSKALGEPITVGGHVFEDGDAHRPSADQSADGADADTEADGVDGSPLERTDPTEDGDG